MSVRNKSGFIGVHFDKHMQRWRAQIHHNKKTICLGYYINIDDAVIARVKKSKELFGEYVNKCEKTTEEKELEELEQDFLIKVK